MGYAKLVFMLLSPAVVLVAADPSVGTWKLDTAKSKFKAGPLYRHATLTISESGSDLDVAFKGTTTSGAAISNHSSVPANGGTGKLIDMPSYDAVSSKRLNATETELSMSKGGKVVYTTRSKLSKDGKTLTAAVKGTSAAGQKVEGTAVYEKQ